MKVAIRPRVLLLLGAVLLAGACTDPVANEPAARRPLARGEEAPPTGGMFGSGHTRIPGDGTVTTTTAATDTTGKNGGMFGSGH